MSIIFSLVIMISFLCLCLSTSTARLNGDLANQKVLQESKFQDPLKSNVEKVKVEKVINTISSSSLQVNATKLNDEHEMKSMSKLDSKSKSKSKSNSSNYHHKRHGKHGNGARNNPHLKNSEKLAKRSKFPKVVSWRVPRSKIEVTQTGFNLDYAPPKVHPPSHN